MSDNFISWLGQGNFVRVVRSFDGNSVVKKVKRFVGTDVNQMSPSAFELTDAERDDVAGRVVKYSEMLRLKTSALEAAASAHEDCLPFRLEIPKVQLVSGRVGMLTQAFAPPGRSYRALVNSCDPSLKKPLGRTIYEIIVAAREVVKDDCQRMNIEPDALIDSTPWENFTLADPTTPGGKYHITWVDPIRGTTSGQLEARGRVPGQRLK